MNEVANFVQQVAKQLSPADLVVIAGVVTTAVHGLLKRYKELSKVVNIAVSFVLPVIGAILATLVDSGSILAHYPQVYAVAQGTYYVSNALKTVTDWLKLGREVSQASAIVPEPEPIQI
jgi:hypothetical protein